MMKLIIPCCGGGDCPGRRPKWMRTTPGGDLRVHAAVARLDLDAFEPLVVIPAEAEAQHAVARVIRRAFGDRVDICVTEEPIHSPPQAVAAVLQHIPVRGAFVVKSPDSAFRFPVPREAANFVCHDSLQNHDLFSVRDKSYLLLDTRGMISRVVEKRIVSEHVGVGACAFRNADVFLSAYRDFSMRLDVGDISPARLVNYLIAGGETFAGVPVADYEDWEPRADERDTRTMHASCAVS
jgi:hypothetical protein